MAAKVYIVGDHGAVYRSDNNGDTWTLKNTGIALEAYHAVSMMPSNNLKVAIGGSNRPVGQSPAIYVSTNGGDTWTLKVINAIAVGAFQTTLVYSIQWVSDLVIYAAVKRSGSDDNFFLVRSGDAGNTWVVKHVDVGPGFIYYMSMYDEDNGFWGQARVQDGGDTITNKPWREGKIQRGTTNGIVRGGNGAGITVDSGATADFNNDFPIARVIYANHFPRTSDGKYIGYFAPSGGFGSNFTGIRRREMVGGSPHEPVKFLAVGVDDKLNGGFFIDGDVGIFVTRNGRVYKTVDACESFIVQPQFTTEELLAIDGENQLLTCTTTLVVDSTTTAIGGAGGSVTFTAGGGLGFEYLIRLVGSASEVFLPLDANPKTVEGLTPGNYEVIVRDSTFPECRVTQLFTISNIENLTATVVKTDVTVNGGSDGTITVNALTGSGDYKLEVLENPPAVFGALMVKMDLPSGYYDVLVTDQVTGQSLFFEDVFINQPSVVPLGGTLLEFPMLNSLQFVVDPIVPDGDQILQDLDNVLLCKQEHPGFDCTNYFNPFCKSDAVPVQFNSDYPEHLAQLINYETQEVVKTFLVTLKEQLLGNTEDHLITLRPHQGFPSQSRVYFNVGTPPIPVAVGDNFTILNNVDGFNGIYSVVDVQIDITLGYEYLVINIPYVAPAQTSAATGRFDSSVENYNVFEFLLDMLDVADGEYFVKVTATFDPLNIKTGWSEPIKLRVSHPDCILMKYRNNDNGYGDISWTTGFIGILRIPALLYKRAPGGERSTSRNADYSLTKINAKKTRGVTFEDFMLPPYLHEKLSVAFDCDFFSLNGKEYQSNDAYEEPKYLDRFLLANSTIKVEQKGWFRKYNSDDIGTVNDGGFITTETGFLKR